MPLLSLNRRTLLAVINRSLTKRLSFSVGWLDGRFIIFTDSRLDVRDLVEHTDQLDAKRVKKVGRADVLYEHMRTRP